MLEANQIRRLMALLNGLGCSTNEAKLYLRTAEAGPSTVQELSRMLGMYRATVHALIKSLIKKGLLFETRRGKRRLVVAEEPSSLYHLLERKEQELQVLKVNVDIAAKLIASIQNPDRSVPVVKAYEGVEGFKKMLDESLSAKNEVLVFSYVDLLAKLVGSEYLERYFQRRASKGIHTRLIFPLCPFAKRVEAKAQQHLIQIRYLPEGLTWQSGIFCWNENVALLSYIERRLTCTVIENAAIADFYRRIIFPMCWENAAVLKSTRR